MTNDEHNKNQADDKSSETRKIRVTLAALTRVEYSEVLEIPASLTQHEVDALVQQRYEDVDGGEYTDDGEYWRRGECHAEAADDSDPSPDNLVSLVGGKFVITPLTIPDEDAVVDRPVVHRMEP